MNTPKVISVGMTTWSEELVEGWPVYLSEEAVKEGLEKWIENAMPPQMRHSVHFINGTVQVMINKMKESNHGNNTDI